MSLYVKLEDILSKVESLKEKLDPMGVGKELFKNTSFSWEDLQKGINILQSIANVIPDFKKGQYSKMDKRYVNKFFPKFIDGKVSVRWKVFYKDPSLKAFWEEKLAVQIQPDKELWDIPEAEEEIINFNKQESKYW